MVDDRERERERERSGHEGLEEEQERERKWGRRVMQDAVVKTLVPDQ